MLDPRELAGLRKPRAFRETKPDQLRARRGWIRLRSLLFAGNLLDQFLKAVTGIGSSGVLRPLAWRRFLGFAWIGLDQACV